MNFILTEGVYSVTLIQSLLLHLLIFYLKSSVFNLEIFEARKFFDLTKIFCIVLVNVYQHALSTR